MDRENELILSGIGACPYCGQAVAVDRREGETPADAAARVCDCIGAPLPPGLPAAAGRVPRRMPGLPGLRGGQAAPVRGGGAGQADLRAQRRRGAVGCRGTKKAEEGRPKIWTGKMS